MSGDLIEKARAMLLSHKPKSTPFSKPNIEAVAQRISDIRGYDDKKVVTEAIAYMDLHFPDYGFYCKLKDLEKLSFGKNRKSKKSKKSKTKKSKKSKKSIRRR